MSSKVRPTMFDTGTREELPSVEPDKRVGGGEYTTPTTNNKELLEDTGFMDKALNAVGIKTLSQEREAEEARNTEKLTEPNVEPLGPEPEPFYAKFMTIEENPLLQNISSSDIKKAVDTVTDDGDNPSQGNSSFFDHPALKKTASALGVNGDFAKLSEGDVNEIGKLASDFSDKAGYNNMATAFGSVGRVKDGIVEYTKAGNNATGVMGLMHSLSGEQGVFDMLDIGAEAAFVHALLQKAIDWNLPYYIDKLTGMIWNNELKQLSLEQSLSRAAQQSNLSLFRKLYEHLDDDRRSRLRDRYLRELIQYYRLGQGADKRAGGLDLLKTMDIVSGTWTDSPIDPGTPYVYYYSFASRDATAAINLTDRWKYALVGSVTRGKSSAQIIRETIPSFTL